MAMCGNISSSQAYLTPIAITLFIIPAFIICICYVVIIAIIWRSSHLLQHNQGGSRHRGKHREEGKRTRSPTQECCLFVMNALVEKKICFLFIVSVVVFVLCFVLYLYCSLCVTLENVYCANGQDI